MRRFLIPTVFLLAGAILLALTLGSRSDEADRGFLADLISRALSTPTTRVSIGAVEGALSSDATIRDITIADKDGVWFRLDRARLVWRRLALLSRRLEVDRLEIGKLEIVRKPLPAEEPVPGANEPLLPELPVKVQVQDFALQELALGESVLGVPAQLSASGAATLGDPSEGLNLRFDARRLDAPGSFVARLLYAAEKLDLTFALDEPAGGILARAANIPGLPPVRLDLSGNGTLDAFAAQLTFDAGSSIGAKGQADLRRDGAMRRLGLNMNARIEGLLPPPIAPVFAGTTELTAETTFADNGAVNISQMAMVSQTARLDVSGLLSSGRDIDLKVSARAIPTMPGKTVAGGAEIRKLAFNGTVAGPLASPRIMGSLQAEDAQLPAGRLATLDATFTATPNGSLSEAATRIALVADAKASGVALTDPALAKAVGPQLTLTLRGNAAPDGTADLETARVTTPTIDATYSGRLGTQDALGRLALKAPDLSRFGDVASLQLRGELDLNADLQGVFSKGPVRASLIGSATRFATGIKPVDGLVDGRLGITGIAQTLHGGGFGLQNLSLAGAHTSLRLDGDATTDKVSLNAVLQLLDLKHADRRLTGRGEVVAQLTGTFTRLNANARAELSNATALGRPVTRLTLDGSVEDLTGLLDAHANLTGDIDGKRANGALHVSRLSNNGWRLEPSELSVGSTRISGQATLDASSLASGRLAVDARNLDDLSPLLLTRLSGDMTAVLALDTTENRQNAQIDARGSRLRLSEVSIDRFSTKASLVDIYAKPVIDGSLAVDRAVISGEAITQIRLDAKGTPAASDIALTAQARNFDLNARGRLIPETPTRFELATFTARRDRHQIALTQPATLTFADGGVDLRRFVLAIDRGTVSIDGRAGSSLDLRLNAQAIPLAAAEIFAPGIGLSGTLDGNVQIGGTAGQPTGNWRLRIARLVTVQSRNIGAPPMDLAAEGQLGNGRTTINGTVNAGRAGTLKATGGVPLNATGELELAVQGRVDLGIANDFLSASGRNVMGVAAIDARIGGTVAEPAVNGFVTLTGGSFTDALQGVRLSDVQGRFAARGTEITIERLSAATRNGGTLAANGRIRIDPAAGFPGDIRITGQHAELVSNDIVTTTADLALSLSGPLAQNPHIDGQVRILSMDVTVPERLPTTVRPIDGTKHVRPTPTAAARLALAARAKANARRAPPFDAMLALTVSAPSRIFVRGRGIDAELGGDLRLTGTLASPVAIGAFELRRGHLSVAGTRLDFTRGRVTFTGDLTPELDFMAETRAGDVTARIGVTGSAREPRFAFSSDPELPQDEVLSRILFSKASGGLSATQALHLAQVAAQFAGGGGDNVFESLRRSLGVEGLDISFGAEGGPSVGISKALSDRISVGVKAGASTEQSGVTVDIDVTRRIRVQGEVGANGNTSIGVGAEWEY
ncbi:translocation/assembly module TamB domain-containing protein [Microvirga sp. 2TAF3]|uniref:translocation/assembly module TamB domain-containing protein n=1 Tax=Microvirga sp. 2TAF3 TaxID=3233014 RepID=UPI003F9BE5B1